MPVAINGPYKRASWCWSSGPRAVPEVWRTERLLAEGATHGLPRDPEAERVVAHAEAGARQAPQPSRTHAPTVRDALAQLTDALERLSEDEPHGGAGVRVRLHEREQDRDRGMGF